MRKIVIAVLALAAILSLGADIRYLLTAEFMPYHAVVSGKSWTQLEPGLQSIILGMLKIVGGGFLACGVALLWLLLPIYRGEAWSRWAALCVAVAVWVPTLYVTIVLRSANSTAQTPVVPTAVILCLVLLGFTVSFFAGKGASRARANE